VQQEKRERIFVSTKFEPHHNSYRGVIRSLESSLKRLKTDYVDLYQVHWPNPKVPIEETIGGIEKLVQDGKVKHIGVCNFSLKQLKEAEKAVSRHKVVAIQAEYNLFNRSIEADVLPYCSTNGITVLGYSPLVQGNLNLNKTHQSILETVAERYGMTIPQVILNWLISHPSVVVLSQSMSFQHTKENAQSADFELSVEDRDTISTLFKRNVVLVHTDKIRVVDYDIDDTHPIYTTLEEALENRFNIQPSPEDLAQDIATDDLLKPVELVAAREKTGIYEYDLIHGRIRYWAWVIAHGGKKPIPAYINDE